TFDLRHAKILKPAQALAQTSTRALAELTEWTLTQRPSVAEIIGRPPRTYDDWAVENADLFR
ncbi:hypothetical protein ACLQ3G_30085, partial [Micromonospora arida]